eukprot:m.20680 g.20680  ORF g.20680 m.20680 type:complete len:371 (+) comp28061_c0_seq2:45-1157(+)
MSWFSRTPPAPAVSATPMAEQRKKHIASLFQQNSRPQQSSVVEVRHQVEYRVDVKASTVAFSIQIELPSNFPTDRPNVRCLNPPIRHAWVDGQGWVTGCRSLNQFYMHSDLGRCIRELVDEFLRNPPQPFHAPPPPPPPQGGVGPGSYPPRFSAPGYTPMPPPPRRQSQPPTYPDRPQMPIPGRPAPNPPAASPQKAPWHYNAPEKPSSFPELEKCSDAELRELDLYTEKLHTLLQSLPAVKKLQEDRDNLTRENEVQAEINLQHEQEVKDQLDRLVGLHDTLQILKTNFEEKEMQQQIKAADFTESMILKRLSADTQRVDDEAEDIAERFLEGGSSIQEFIREFMERKSKYHELKAKEEKLERRTQASW